MTEQDADGIVDSTRANAMTQALTRAPWWATLIVYFGLPSAMGLLAFLVFLGLIPSPYMLDKFAAIDTHLAKNRASMEQIARTQETLTTEIVSTLKDQVEEIRHLRACIKHPEWKSCED